MSETQVTLCYIVQAGRALLIHKRRGLGAGKINGPGGKVHLGETPLAAAVRETEEEIGVTPLNLNLRGELWFHFSAEEISHCFIYLSESFSGQPRETIEATPEWFAIDSLPYERMWDDDRYWLPLLLSGQFFHATVTVRGEKAEPPIFHLL